MSDETRRREASSGDIRRVLREVAHLRAEAARAAAERDGEDYDAELPVPVPPGGWKPIFDDEGRVIPDPLPDVPTDVPADDVERAKADAELGD